MILGSYVCVILVTILYKDLNNLQSAQPLQKHSPDIFENAEFEFQSLEAYASSVCLFLLTSIAVILSAIGAALSESTIVGFLRVFQAEQIEEFGMGTSLALVGDLVTFFILNNF